MSSHPRIGPRMAQAAMLVRQNPGCAILPVARAVAPHDGKGLQYGYRAVHRAIDAGLIRAVVTPSGRYSLTAPQS